MTLPELLTAARDDCAALTPSARVSFRRVAILENAPGGGWDERNLLLATESNSLVIFTRASQMLAEANTIQKEVAT